MAINSTIFRILKAIFKAKVRLLLFVDSEDAGKKLAKISQNHLLLGNEGHDY